MSKWVKVNEIIENAEKEELYRIEMKISNLIEKCRDLELNANHYEAGQQISLRINDFKFFKKDKMQRFLNYLDEKVLDDKGREDNNRLMYIHTVVLLSIIEACKENEWNISQKWIIE